MQHVSETLLNAFKARLEESVGMDEHRNKGAAAIAGLPDLDRAGARPENANY